MDSSTKVNWENEETSVLLNPRLLEAERDELQRLTELYSLKAHVWVASSGSSKSADSSVKLIALSKAAFLVSAQSVNKHLLSTKDDCWIQVLPNFHVGGCSMEARSFLSGARVVNGFANGKWEARAFHQAIEDNKGTLSALVPTQVVDLVQAGLRCPPSMRSIVIGGSALSLELYQQALDLGWPLLPSYGMTECCSQIATANYQSLKSRQPELKILSHIQADINEDGFLKIQSTALLTGYAQVVSGQPAWKDPKMEGWYQTEDFAEIKGRILRPLGRGSDFVKVSGEGVNLQKLQEILESIALQRNSNHWQQVALVALPEARTQFQICLVSSLTVADEFLNELTQEFNSKVAPFERIRVQRKVSAIPRTALGKIARGTLKDFIL